LHEPERAKRVYALLEAIDWKWPPDVIERQDDLLMEDIAAIASSSAKIKRFLETQRKDKNE